MKNCQKSCQIYRQSSIKNQLAKILQVITPSSRYPHQPWLTLNRAKVHSSFDYTLYGQRNDNRLYMAILGKNIVAKVFQNCQNGDKSTHLVKLLSVCISCLSSLSVFCLCMNFAQIVTFKILFYVFDKSLVDFLNNLFHN